MIGRSHQYDVAADGRFLINVDADDEPFAEIVPNTQPIPSKSPNAYGYRSCRIRGAMGSDAASVVKARRVSQIEHGQPNRPINGSSRRESPRPSWTPYRKATASTGQRAEPGTPLAA